MQRYGSQTLIDLECVEQEQKYLEQEVPQISICVGPFLEKYYLNQRRFTDTHFKKKTSP